VPNMCYLCRTHQETLQHIFQQCSYTIQLRDYMKTTMIIQSSHRYTSENSMDILLDRGETIQSKMTEATTNIRHLKRKMQMYICPKVSGYNSNSERDSFRAQGMVLTNNTLRSERHRGVPRFKQSTRVVPDTCWHRICWVLLVDEKKRLDAGRTLFPVQGCSAMLLRLIRTALDFAPTNRYQLVTAQLGYTSGFHGTPVASS
jgi:hypothetical protein